jgi:hypothetical protein
MSQSTVRRAKKRTGGKACLLLQCKTGGKDGGSDWAGARLAC